MPTSNTRIIFSFNPDTDMVRSLILIDGIEDGRQLFRIVIGFNWNPVLVRAFLIAMQELDAYSTSSDEDYEMEDDDEEDDDEVDDDEMEDYESQDDDDMEEDDELQYDDEMEDEGEDEGDEPGNPSIPNPFYDPHYLDNNDEEFGNPSIPNPFYDPHYLDNSDDE